MLSDNQPQKPPNQRSPRRYRLGRTLGVAMVIAGAILLTAISGYYAYSANARSQLDELNFAMPQAAQTASVQPTASQASSIEPTPAQSSFSAIKVRSVSVPAVSAVSAGSATNPPASHASASPVSWESAANQENPAMPASSYAALYPATRIHPKFWDMPLWSGGEPYLYAAAGENIGLPDGFRVVSAMDDAMPRGRGAPTTRIAIPLIDVDSGTKELEIFNLGDSRAYETPKHLVGHIPQSPNPGEIGNAWYFGHLESPIRGEGNVFQRLPEIPDLLRDGDDVFVELKSADGRFFLYKTTRTEVVHQDELELYGADVAQITLVACVPRLVYDHRIVVTAELVGVKDPPAAVAP